MGKKLYVGNLPFSATDQVLLDAFSQCGAVDSAKIIIDRSSGRSKGFGFVEMTNDAEALEAINKFNGADCDGRSMVVNEARPMVPRDRASGMFRDDFRSGDGGGGRNRRF